MFRRLTYSAMSFNDILHFKYLTFLKVGNMYYLANGRPRGTFEKVAEK